MAKHARIHSTTLSQVLKGDREFSLEQAALVCDYLGLSERETEFFLLLLQHEKASSPAVKGIFEKLLREKHESSLELSQVLPSDRTLSIEEKSIYYSSWFYSATRLLSSIPRFKTREAMLEKLGISRTLFSQVLEFLLKTGLCEEMDGKLTTGHLYTHLESTSPLIGRHHGNWRVKAMEKHSSLSKDSLCYTAPMSISKKDAERVRELAVKFVADIQKIREDSECEEAFCLNLDWFAF